jgi:hypothetical protein
VGEPIDFKKTSFRRGARSQRRLVSEEVVVTFTIKKCGGLFFMIILLDYPFRKV